MTVFIQLCRWCGTHMTLPADRRLGHHAHCTRKEPHPMELIIVALFFAFLTIASWLAPNPDDDEPYIDNLTIRDGRIVTDVLEQKDTHQ